jgi:hypothetical protein
MNPTVKLATLLRDHGPVSYESAPAAETLSEGNFAGVFGDEAKVGVRAEAILIWKTPLPKSITTITNLDL